MSYELTRTTLVLRNLVLLHLFPVCFTSLMGEMGVSMLIVVLLFAFLVTKVDLWKR